MRGALFAAWLVVCSGTTSAQGGSLDAVSLSNAFAGLAMNFDGRVGICARDGAHLACLHGDQRFPMQSVFKVLVAAAALERVDQGIWHLNDPVLVRRGDLSVFVQPIAKLVGDNSYRTDLGDLIRRAVVDSDSAATDILIARLGGPKSIDAFLRSNHLKDIRVDRDEKHLQPETFGLHWRSAYLDPKALDAAIHKVPAAQRDTAFKAYLTDPRDSATPRGMSRFLLLLTSGKLLSPKTTAYLTDVLAQTTTFPTRLKAGLSAGWTLGHKTGTGGTWRGAVSATNDVGILTAPDGRKIAIAVFVSNSHRSESDQDALVAMAARATIAAYR